jgi:hypothetical protein
MRGLTAARLVAGRDFGDRLSVLPYRWTLTHGVYLSRIIRAYALNLGTITVCPRSRHIIPVSCSLDPLGRIDHIQWMIAFLSVLLGLALVAVLLVLIGGVVVFARGGEINRRYGNRIMNLRVATQAVAVAILGLILLLRAVRW